MEQVLEFLATNAVRSKARREKLHGRDFLVASSTLIVPGVLAGSKGAIFYSAEEASRDPMAWNHMPIVARHPMKDGQPVSARTPDVLNKHQLGFVFNAVGGEKLGSELWYDEELTRNFDQTLEDKHKIVPRLERGDPIELSTGIFMKLGKAPDGAVHNGKAYVGIAKDIVPDHLATLPDQIGACSVKDGCGVGINTETMTVTMPKSASLLQKLANLFKQRPANNQLSHDELRSELSDQLGERFNGTGPMNPAEAVSSQPYGWCYVADVYDKYVLFQFRDKTWKLGYSLDLRTSEVTLDQGVPTEVERNVTWKEVTNKQGEQDMVKDELVKHLATNCDCWKGDEKTLATFTEEKLNLLKAQHDKAVAAPAAPAVPATNAAAAPVAQPLNQEQLVAIIGPAVKAAVQNMMTEQQQKQPLVNQLTAAIVDPARKAARQAILFNESVAELQERVKDLPPITEAQQGQGHYGLAGGWVAPVVDNAAKDKDEADVLPISINESYEDERRVS